MTLFDLLPSFLADSIFYDPKIIILSESLCCKILHIIWTICKMDHMYIIWTICKILHTGTIYLTWNFRATTFGFQAGGHIKMTFRYHVFSYRHCHNVTISYRHCHNFILPLCHNVATMSQCRTS